VLNVVSGSDINHNGASSGGGIYTVDGGHTNIYGSFVRFNTPDDTHTVNDGSTTFVDPSGIARAAALFRRPRRLSARRTRSAWRRSWTASHRLESWTAFFDRQ
jgi:hypothetical protein